MVVRNYRCRNEADTWFEMTDTCAAMYYLMGIKSVVLGTNEFHLYEPKCHGDALIISSSITFYNETKTLGTEEEPLYFMFIYLESGVLKIKANIYYNYKNKCSL